VYLVDNTPTTIEEAFSSPDADLWKEAIRSEMESIMSGVPTRMRSLEGRCLRNRRRS
jgi:hypothetical protein